MCLTLAYLHVASKEKKRIRAAKIMAASHCSSARKNVGKKRSMLGQKRYL